MRATPSRSSGSSPEASHHKTGSIARALLRWYDRAKRDLPWRQPENQTPYRVWLSEIMLQQTTVATVIPYYERFLTLWPTVHTLASAREEEVMAAWAGLGYYSRARNLHACARQVMKAWEGNFPDTEENLRKLPGVGPYTAAAIAAIAFNHPANVVDGNVERVMARLFADPGDKRHLKALAAPLVPRRRAGDYAQALMDLGATVCTPRSPLCADCPLSAMCRARSEGDPTAYPRREKRSVRPVRRGIVGVVFDPGTERVWVRRRPPKGLLGGMLEFPSSAWDVHPSPPSASLLLPLLSPLFPRIPVEGWTCSPTPIRHVFTHFDLELSVGTARVLTNTPADDGFWLDLAAVDQEAFPTLMRKILKSAQAGLQSHGTERIPQSSKFTRSVKRV